MTAKRRQPKTASLEYETLLYRAGLRRVVGIDEAGRGAWAGPVYAGAVCLPPPTSQLVETLAGVRDSKQMTPLQRARLALVIKEHAACWGVGYADHDEIDALGINPATRLAMERALHMMANQRPGFEPEFLLLDSLPWNLGHERYQSILHGDQRSLSIAAASVLAKVTRDETLVEMDAEFPGYGFGAHKGYGTAAHIAALKQQGVSPVHRRSYAPIRRLLDGLE